MDDAPLTIEGLWQEEDGVIVASPECRIIEHLLQDHLILVGQRESGWTRLYRDPTTNHYWELTCEHSEQHGGGPPTLKRMSHKEADDKYHSL